MGAVPYQTLHNLIFSCKRMLFGLTWNATKGVKSLNGSSVRIRLEGVNSHKF